jgi:ubiquinone/menaquinone biosynthesis C-methylase UbiE
MPTESQGDSNSFRAVQAFEDNENLRPNELCVEMQQLLLDWAATLPAGFPIIDLAAGQGIEAHYLATQGYSIIAQDPSELFANNSYHSNNRIGVAEALPDADASAGGILLKDAWMFLSPTQRMACLTESFRVLVPGGSLLLLSEQQSAHRARYLPNNSQLPQVMSGYDYSNDETYFSELEKLAKENNVFTLEYRSTADEVISLAETAGFTLDHQESYSATSALARKNKWAQKAGFILVLKKSQ